MGGSLQAIAGHAGRQQRPPVGEDGVAGSGEVDEGSGERGVVAMGAVARGGGCGGGILPGSQSHVARSGLVEGGIREVGDAEPWTRGWHRRRSPSKS